MKTKNDSEDNIEQTQIKDLTVNGDRAAEVKGGPTRGNGGGSDVVVFDIVDSCH